MSFPARLVGGPPELDGRTIELESLQPRWRVAYLPEGAPKPFETLEEVFERPLNAYAAYLKGETIGDITYYHFEEPA
jgi:hypothetical protein